MSEEYYRNTLENWRVILEQFSTGSNYMRFGTWLYYERCRRQVPISRLAEKTGYSQVFLRLLERGKRAPTVESARIIADALMLNKREAESRAIVERVLEELHPTRL